MEVEKFYTYGIECVLVKPSQVICIYVACTQIAGIGLCTRWKPQTSREHYPRPQTVTDDQAATNEVLEGLDTKDLAMSNSGSDSEFQRHPSRCDVETFAQTRTPAYEGQNLSHKAGTKSRLAPRAAENERPVQETREKLGA